MSSARQRRASARTAHARRASRRGLAARPGRGAGALARGACASSSASASPSGRTSSPAACRSAPSASSRSRARSPPTRCCWCSTSRPRACAARRSRRSPSCCATLRGEGVTILIVEHDMDFVMRLVDRLVVMNFGAKLVEGAAGGRARRPRGCRPPISAERRVTALPRRSDGPARRLRPGRGGARRVAVARAAGRSSR